MRHQLTTHPIRTLAALLVLAFAFFMLSASGQSGTYWENGPGWLGSVAWPFFLLSALAFVVCAVILALRAMRGRTTA